MGLSFHGYQIARAISSLCASVFAGELITYYCLVQLVSLPAIAL